MIKATRFKCVTTGYAQNKKNFKIKQLEFLSKMTTRLGSTKKRGGGTGLMRLIIQVQRPQLSFSLGTIEHVDCLRNILSVQTMKDVSHMRTDSI